MESLNEFARSLGGIVSDHDKKVIDSFKKVLDKLILTSKVNKKSKSSSKKSYKITLKEQDYKKLIAAVGRRNKIPHSDILYRSSFVMLFTYFDNLLSDLMHNYYERYPKSFEGENFKISLSELTSINDIKEAKEYLINKHIDSQMYNSLESQINYFKDHLNVSCKKEDLNWENIDEVRERRNIIVHNGGIVNRKYVQKFKKRDLSTDVEILKEGDVLKIDSKYFLKSLDALFFAGIIFTQECWRTWSPKETESADITLNNVIINLLLEEKWSLAQKMSQYGEKSNPYNEEHRLLFYFNYCQSLKWQKKNKELEKELDKLDTSSLKPKYLAAHSALINDIPNFYKYVKKAVASGDLDKDHLFDWPIFREIRKNKNFRVKINRIFREIETLS